MKSKRNKIDELNNQYNNILENINLEKEKNEKSNYDNDINTSNFNNNVILNKPQYDIRPSITVKKIQKKQKESNFYQSQNNNLSTNKTELLETKIKYSQINNQNNNLMNNNKEL